MNLGIIVIALFFIIIGVFAIIYFLMEITEKKQPEENDEEPVEWSDF